MSRIERAWFVVNEHGDTRLGKVMADVKEKVPIIGIGALHDDNGGVRARCIGQQQGSSDGDVAMWIVDFFRLVGIGASGGGCCAIEPVDDEAGGGAVIVAHQFKGFAEFGEETGVA